MRAATSFGNPSFEQDVAAHADVWGRVLALAHLRPAQQADTRREPMRQRDYRSDPNSKISQPSQANIPRVPLALEQLAEMPDRLQHVCRLLTSMHPVP